MIKLNSLRCAAGLILLAALPAQAAAYELLAEWNFNNFVSETTTAGWQETFTADAGEGILFVQNATDYGSNFRRSTGDGTLVNAVPGTEAGGCIELRRGERWNNGFLELRLDLTGYRDLVVSCAFHYMSSTFPSSTTVEWSTDNGASYTPLTTLVNADYAGGYNRLELDFSGVPALNNQPSVRVRLRFSADGGAASSGAGARFDNILLQARSAPVNTVPALIEVIDQPTDRWVPVHLGLSNAISPAPAVRVLDADGQPLRWGVEVTAQLAPYPFAAESTVSVVTDFDGMARFDALLLDTAAEDYVITYTADGLAPAESSLFAGVAVPLPDLLVLENPPGDLWSSGDPVRLLPAPRVRAELADGTPLPFIEVTAALAPHGFAGGSVTTVLTGADGVARFGDLWLDTPETGYQLTFSATGAPPVDSAPFDLVVLDHAPRLFATPERIGRARDAASLPGSHHEEAIQAMKDRVAGGVAAYRPGFHVDRFDYQYAWMAREAGLLYLITGEQQYADAAYTALQGIASDGITNSDGLWRSTVSMGFALAYDWAGNGWSQAQRDWALAEINRGLDAWPSFSHPNFQNPGASNWVAVCRGAELVLLLAAGDEASHRGYAWYRNRWRDADDTLGYSQEGMGYHSFGGGFLYPAAMALEETLGDDKLSKSLRGRRPWRPFMYNVAFAYSSIDAIRRDMPIYLPTGVSNPDFYEEGLTSLFLGLADGHADAPYYRHFYDRVTGVEAPLSPEFKYDQHRAGTTWAVLFHDPGLASLDPTGVWPAAIEDNRGYAWYRNRWRDADDTLGYLMADAEYHARAWDSEEALAMSLFSNGTLFFHGPATATDTPANFTSILVDGDRPTKNETGQRVLFESTLDDAYIVVAGGPAYQAVGLDEIDRHLLVSLAAGRDSGRALFSTLDRFAADQPRTVTWHANLTMPRAHAIDLTLATEGGRPAFILRGEGDSYLKGWVLHPADATVSDAVGNLAISTTAQQGDIWVAWVTGAGEPPVAAISGSGLQSELQVDGQLIAYDDAEARVTATASAPPTESYDAWRLDRYGDLTDPDGAPEYDPGNRGYSNALEYALGLPHAGLPRLLADGSLRFTRRATSDARIIVERAGALNPADFLPVAVFEPGGGAWSGSASISEQGDGSLREVLDARPLDLDGEHPHRFIRVLVELP